MALLAADVGMRLSRMETLVADLHWRFIGQWDAQAWAHSSSLETPLYVSCPTVQDHGVSTGCSTGASASKKRRARATRTRQKLWNAAAVGRDKLEDDVTSTCWETMEKYSRNWCVFEEVASEEADHKDELLAAFTVAADLWSASDIESWIRSTLRLANAAALESVTKEDALAERSRIISEQWEQASLHISDTLREEVWSILSEPLNV